MVMTTLLAFAQEDGMTTETYQRLTGIPKPPVAGTTVNFVYHPQGGPLADAKEAVAFAILANECIHEQPNNMVSVTGAKHPVIMGKISL